MKLLQLKNKYEAKPVIVKKVLTDLHFEKLTSDLEKAFSVRSSLNYPFLKKEEITFIKYSLNSYCPENDNNFRSEGYRGEIENLKLRNENFISDAFSKFIDWLKSLFGGSKSKEESEKAAKAAVAKISNLEELDLSKLNKIYKGSTEEEILQVISKSSEESAKVISVLDKTASFIEKLTVKVKNKEDISNSVEELLEDVFKPLKIENSLLDKSLKDSSETADFYCVFADYYLKDGVNYILELEPGDKVKLKFTKTTPSSPSDRLKKLVLNADDGYKLSGVLLDISEKLTSAITNANFNHAQKEFVGLLDNLKSDEISIAREILALKNIFKSMSDFFSYMLDVEDALIYSVNLINAAMLRFNEKVDAANKA